MQLWPPNVVLEFGSGLFSTRLFLEMSDHVITVETMHREWYEHVRDSLSPREGCYWNPAIVDLHDQLAHADARLSLFQGKADIIFVDGDDRVFCCLWAFSHAPVVVLHDAQKKAFQDIKTPNGYSKYVFRNFPVWYPEHDADGLEDRPWTTVWVDRLSPSFSMVKTLYETEATLYDEHKFPYFQDQLPSIGEIT